MSSKPDSGHNRRTVRYRLTKWFLILFGAISLVVLAVTDFHLRSVLREHTCEDLTEDLHELREHYRADGVAALEADFKRESESSGIDEIYLVLHSPDGEVVASSDPLHWSGAKIGDEPLPQSTDSVAIYPLTYGDDQEDGLVGETRLHDGSQLSIHLSLDEEKEWTELFWSVLLVALAGMLASGAVMAWLLARRSMTGVQRVTTAAAGMSRERLGERVDVGSEGREIEELAVAFNGMLERIDGLVNSLREVTDNLAHDLRSAVTRLRGMAETTLTTDTSLPEFRELAANVIEEADALIRLCNTMLEIAETDAGRARIKTTAVDVAELLHKTADIFRPAAEDAGLRLEVSDIGQDLKLLADLSRMQRIMANLVDNAIKYSPAGGTITLRTGAQGERVFITVRDQGIGIAGEDLPKIFQRFYRADASRSHMGSGLGLSLCQTLAEAMGGGIAVDSTMGEGTSFTIDMPRAPDD